MHPQAHTGEEFMSEDILYWCILGVCNKVRALVRWLRTHSWVSRTRFVDIETGATEGWTTDIRILSTNLLEATLRIDRRPAHSGDILLLTDQALRRVYVDASPRPPPPPRNSKVMLAYVDNSSDMSEFFNARLASFDAEDAQQLQFCEVLSALSLPPTTSRMTLVLDDLRELAFGHGDIVAW